MRLLEKLFGSDMNLSRPDFDRHDTLKFQFADVNVEFPDAPQTAVIPFFSPVLTVDIKKCSSLTIEPNDSYPSLKIYSKGWNFKGRGGEDKGGVIISAVLHRASEKKDRSLFSKKVLESGLLAQSKVFIAAKKSSANDDCQLKVRWCEVKCGQGCYAVIRDNYQHYELIFWLPLDDFNVISFRVRASSYNGLDIHSPETNLKETIHAVIDDFISGIQIHYPERCLEQIKAAQAS